MKEFFEEYGWSLITLIGGVLGLSIAFGLTMGKDSQLGTVIDTYMNGIMKSPSEPIEFTLKADNDSDGKISKGDIITIGYGLDMNGDGADDTFKVMELNGNEATVFAVENYKSVKYSETGRVYEFDVEATDYVYGVRYNESTLDKTMNEYFNSLPELVKKAVVKSQPLTQNMYKWSGTSDATAELNGTYTEGGATKNYSLKKMYSTDIGSIMVYAPDLSDFIRYYGGNVTEAKMQTDFFGSNVKQDRRIWLRSCTYKTTSGDEKRARVLSSSMGVTGAAGDINTVQETHPMFTIELN